MFGFSKRTKVVRDEIAVSELLGRGVENIFPNREFVKAKLLKGERVTLYLGIDPTGTTLHLGHALILKKLRDFQKQGHQVILLIGDFTATIGDPTDKTAARKKLTHAQVLQNAERYQAQASLFLDFTGPNRALLKYNSSWLGKMKFGDVLELASHMTVDQMLKRDMFDVRMKEGKPIYIHEFLYPLMQGYDSVAMDVDGEIGGNDQTFNMLAGRDLMKSINNKEKFVISMKLLVDQSGKKMGKTEGNMVSFDLTPQDTFGRVMSWTDGLIIPGFELCTDISSKEISEMQNSFGEGANPRDAKARLAYEIVKLLHGSTAAHAARDAFFSTFKEGDFPDDAVTIEVPPQSLLADTLLKQGIVSSKSDFRRLVEGGGIHDFDSDATLTAEYSVDKDIRLRIGKKRFVKLVVRK